IDAIIYFSEAAPENAKWYFYSSINGWTDYSQYATFSEDRRSVTLELKDGDYGDADGIANGIIVDPCGFGIASWIQGSVSDSTTSKKITTAIISFEDLNLDLNTLLDGNYVSMILPGSYDFSISAPGYASQTFSSLEIEEDCIVTKDIELLGICEKAVLTSPAETTIDLKPVFAWDKDSHATWYQLFIWDSSENRIHAQWYESSNVCSGVSCSVTLETELSNDNYEWFVKSWNDYGSLWSDGMAFTVQGDENPPLKVIHTSPSGQTQNFSPTYTWAADPASTWYKLWIGSPNGDRLFAQWYDAADICSGGICSVVIEIELLDGDYEWYIKSWNDYGRIWSDGMSFTVSE
ncbi:MAG: carboxypeptidase-like regulatory domain-containing protein, partial [Desulfobacula sp.]|nr:carboxypeptidase-like regulatory domain-containing protein [Desulfobacula sp.]